MKDSYSIPYSLDSSYLDMQITIQTESGIGARPVTIKTVLLILGGIVSCFLMVSKTFVASGTFWQKVVFAVFWMGLCGLLLTSSRTNEMGLSRIFSLISYLNTGSRFIGTRRGSAALPFAQLTGIADVDEASGLITYLDGSVGYLFDVTGNGSVLLFDSHKEAIIDRVDAHYRKMKPGTTYHFVTVKQPQEVIDQLEALDYRETHLTCSDPDLTAMMETDRHVLTEIVGSSYKSLHQYMLMQAKTLEDLQQAMTVLQSEVENSTLMFRRVILMAKPDMVKFFSDIYR